MKGLKLYLLEFFLVMIKSGFVICENQSFTIAFMTNINRDESTCENDLLLYIAASETTNCTVSAPKSNFYEEVQTSNVVEVKLPRRLALSGSGVEQKGIAVSCNASVNVYGFNLCEYNSDGFSVIPNSHLGYEYFAFTVKPLSSPFHSEVAVVSFNDNTEVTLCLPSCSDCNVDIANNIYGPSSCMIQTLNAYETIQIQSKGNLAGTYICSSNPVAVFSGNERTCADINGNREHLVVQMPSFNFWGTRFVSIPPFYNGNRVFLMTKTNKTSVNISCTGTNPTQTDVFNAGDIFQMPMSTYEFCFIETNYPVFAVQVIGEEPSLLPLTPIDKYSSNYSFMGTKTSLGGDFVTHFVYVIEESAASNLMLDSQIIQMNQNYNIIPGTDLIGGYLQVTDQPHHVTHPYANFNCILLGEEPLRESFAISLGWNWKITTETFGKPTSAGSTMLTMSTFLQNDDVSTVAETTSAISPYDSPVCPDNLHDAYFIDLAQGYFGYEIIAEYVVMSIIQCALECQQHNLCTSFQLNTQTSTDTCYLLRIGGNTLDSSNGQIFTMKC